MSKENDTRIMAVYCDFENVALGVKDSEIPKFDMNKVLERLLLKGNIVVKKAYCDWARYREFKGVLHESSFELIEIPHVRMSGKNSADIRMVVDALDLCYTKEHVDTFVVISGDSDFSPLVSKLRENNKNVIGVGVKKSTSDLLIANCDEFIYYDDLVKPSGNAKKAAKKTVAKKTTKTVESNNLSQADARKQEACDLVTETYEALLQERGEEDRIWGSMLKQAIKRRKPGFSESYYGYRSFGDVLRDAEKRGLVKLQQDEKSGQFIVSV